MASLNLLGTMTRIETPFISVKIGNYTFGVYDKFEQKNNNNNSSYTLYNVKYPNYIQSLNVKKINGQVNKYTIIIKYAITSSKDPNFFEKVFSSVSSTRSITFSYGDMSMPTYIYKEEEAMITDIKSQFDFNDSAITYTVTAISSGIISTATIDNWDPLINRRPSDRIKEMLRNNEGGILEVFYGMKDISEFELNRLIPGEDSPITLDAQTNMSTLDYLKLLVNSMTPQSSLVIRDDSTVYTNKGIYYNYGGPYFEIKPFKLLDDAETYSIDIGYPSNNIVTSFIVDDNQTYSILYDYSESIDTTEYVKRINDDGEVELVYSPSITSNNENNITHENDSVWWSKVTGFPISAQLTLKGLLRPAMLMTHIRVNVLFYGRKHVSSGLYIITQQIDNIDGNGFRTTLSLTRVGEDPDSYL